MLNTSRLCSSPMCGSIAFGLIVAALSLAALPVTAQDAKPRMLFVNVEKAMVHCGPDKSYYSTSILRRGDAVEVYDQTESGWAAIRPPQDSFDWLAAEHAYLLPGGTIAEVIGEPMPSWIGSELGTPKRYRWQLELQPNQQMRVLGESRQAIEDGKEKLWYKIAPPPGEFRWIPLDILVDEPIAHDQLSDKTVTKVKPVSAKSAQNSRSGEGVDQAQYVIGGDEILPTPGDEIIMEPGEDFIVDSDEIPYDSDEEYFEEPSIEEPMVFDGGCHGCFPSRFGCGCTCRNNPNEGLIVHRLNGILGLVGFGVAKLPYSPDKASLGESFPAPTDVPARLEHLPRPIRRGRISTLGPSSFDGVRSLLQDQSSYDGVPVAAEAQFDRSLLASANTSTIGNTSGGGLLATPIGTGLAANGAANGLATSPASSNSGWHATRSNSPTDFSSNVVLASASMPMASNVASMPAPLARNLTSSGDQSIQFTSPQLQNALIELSRIVSKPTEQWDLSSLRASALRWIEQGNSTIERGEARLLLERIDRFDSLRNRMNASDNGLVVSGVSPASDASSATSSSLDASQNNANEADASGWLTQVHTSHPGQPEFALTDLAGNVIAYVNPAPGVNLRRYNREAVAIYGIRGYLPDLAAKQITAERVVRLR